MNRKNVVGFSITISEQSSLVLSALYELQNAGLIESGDRTLIVSDGYDGGAAEVDAAPVVTELGIRFVRGSI